MNSTTTLLDEAGLKLDRFEPALAAFLGNDPGRGGGKVLFEARGGARVELRHWLYALAKAPGSLLRARIIEAIGKDPDRFVEAIEEGLGPTAQAGRPVRSLTRATVSDEVVAMLAEAENCARQSEPPRINEAMLTFALWKTADALLKGLLQAWATEEGWEKFLRLVHSRFAAVEPLKKENLWDEKKRLRLELLTPGCRKFCRRLREDAASLNASKLTTLHLLYSLLGTETSLLCRALAMRGTDVKRELHPNLSRQLVRPGSKRNMEFDLTSDTVLGGVSEVFVRASVKTRERGSLLIPEADLSRAFIELHARTLLELFPKEKAPDPTSLRDYMDSVESDEIEHADEEDSLRVGVAEISRRIQARIRGQPQALARIVPWIKRLRFGLPRKNRPAAVLLFLGPTGTGKTQTAKELARYVFGNEESIIFLEMGQFKTKESMSTLVGAPPGYVGYGEGKLTNGLRDMPECVVLFDEIEKADTQVFDTILRFADEGLISDPAGPVRDGRKCIIILTSNAGQTWLRQHLKKDANVSQDPVHLTEQLYEAAVEELRRLGFRPEFIGRVDEKITFLPFTEQTCAEIVADVLEEEKAQFQSLKNVEILLDAEAQKVLTNQSMERSLEEGARCIPRIINQLIITPAIDLLATEEDRVGLPRRLHVSRDGLTGLKVEVEAI